MVKTVAAICTGASIGALLRYALGLYLNAIFPLVPLGTLVANLLGGYLIGLAIGAFEAVPVIDPRWQLFIITGLLGALTTFSTFSAEVVTLMLQQRFIPAMVTVLLHVAGSLCMTFLGLGTIGLVRRALV